jgi:phage-related protein
MAGNSAGSIAVDLVLNNRSFNNQVKSNIKSTESAFSSSFKKIGGFVAAAFAVEKVVSFGKAAVQAASDAQAAWTGLNSIVQGTGNNFDVAHGFLTKFTQDGLVGIEDAATAYKNLLARGYDTTQIENVMTALKDSAAFGRQSSYTLSQAVVSATEGLKNENSILVDNAGVTKNVAKMWDEYAASIGKTANNLTQQEKIQAEVNGIMKETRFQAGDAATYTSTFAGKIQVLKGAFSSMQIAIGKVVAPIVGLFVPAITSAINAVTAFFNKMQSVLSVFGLEFPDVVEKTSSGISNIGSSAADTASKIAGTGTAAKKAAKAMNKAFSSVDEINVISSKSASSGGADSTGGIGGAGGSTAVTTGNDAVSSAVQATSENIMKYIRPLQDISFSNLISAFGELKESVMDLGKTIWEGLEWAYFNILVPLAQWTIEDALPTFFHALSGAIDVVNVVLDDLKPIFKWFWDTVLVPIASWTGGVIVDILNGLGDALKWIADNEVAVAILEGLGIAIGIVSGALAIYNLVGGLANGIMLAYNGIAAISAAVTTAFGTAMAFLTSPITLVTLAIAAIIAIIILLVKNWDTVKEVAINVWNKIKEIWGNVATWFSEKVVTPVKNFFSGMWNGLKNGASSAWSGIKSVFSTVTTWFKDKFTQAWTAVKNVFSKGGKIFDGIKDGIASVFKTVVNGLIGGINKVIAVPFNAINKLLNKIDIIEK